MLCYLFYIQKFFLKKMKISIFGGISKFLKLIVFGQILAKFGTFGQFWADLAAMVAVDSMPSLKRKKIKCYNLWRKCHNLACNGLLESLLNFPSTKKVSKIQSQIRIVVVCPKSLNSICETHNPSRVKVNYIQSATIKMKSALLLHSNKCVFLPSQSLLFMMYNQHCILV